MMKFLRLLFILIIPVMTYYSCGGDSSSSSSSGSEEEQDSGTNGGTSGGSSSCLTSNQRKNITSVLNRLANMGSITGRAIEEIENTHWEGGYSITKNGANVWIMSGGFCSTDDTCADSESTLEFKNGCFFQDNVKAKINSATSSRFTTTTTLSDKSVENYSLSVSSGGTVRERIDTKKNGVNIFSWRFTSSNGGSEETTGGDEGGTDGGDEGGTDGGDEGGTDGGDEGGTAGGTVGGTVGGEIL